MLARAWYLPLLIVVVVVAATIGGVSVSGTSAGERIVGTSTKDTLSGRGGADTILGRGAADTISGGSGNDQLSGEGGNDQMSGEGGADVISGNSGADRMSGGDGNDRIYGSASGVANTTAGDTLSGDAGNDTLWSKAPSGQRLNGGTGDDMITLIATSTTAGGNLVSGGDGNDRISIDLAATVASSSVSCGPGDDFVNVVRAKVSIAPDCEHVTPAEPVVVDPEPPSVPSIVVASPVTDNYKACSNSSPSTPESRTWFQWGSLAVASRVFQPVSVPTAGSTFENGGVAVRDGNGARARMTVSLVSGPGNQSIYTRVHYSGQWGVLLTLSDRAAFTSTPVVVKLALRDDATSALIGERVVEYRYDPALAASPPNTPEWNGPAGRWSIDGVSTRTDSESPGTPYIC